MGDLKENIVNEQYFKKDNTFFTVAKYNPLDLVEKEIGDSKEPTKFLPQQKVTRWDNEVNVSVRLVHDEKTPVVSQEGDIVKWQGDKVEAHFYDINSQDHPEGASEFEIVLKEKPKTNVVQFTLVDKGVEYSYQPALTEQEIADGASRPENVIGSYAVYASENKTNYVGGKEYKCGKVGHIYRPQIEDSAGNKVWGELNIENGILSVTIPQKFLDTAVYPVKHAAGLTFGYTSLTASGSYSFAINTLWGTNFTAPEDATIDSITIGSRYGSLSGNHYFKGVMVDNSNVILANGVGGSVSIGYLSSYAWVTSYYTTKPSISSGVVYNICAVTSTVQSVSIPYDSETGHTAKYHSSNNYNSPTNPSFSNGANRRFSIYATYTAAPTEEAPTVTTQAVSSIAQTTATGNGNVTDDGGATVTERGVCWGTSTNPTIAGSHAAAAAGGEGAFTADITGLSAGTHYYVRAYATNSVGTSYGDNVEFTTGASITEKNVSDTGGGAETVDRPYIALTNSDSGEGSEVIQLLALISTTDSGSSVEVLNVLNSLLVNENASASDLLSILTILSQADTATGSDTSLLTILLTISEAGLGAESISLLNQFLIADTASGNDSVLLTAILALQEVGSGTDIVSLLNNLAISDTFEVEEGITLLNSINTPESATGSENEAILGIIATQEAGEGSDSQEIFNTLPTATDLASGSEGLQKAEAGDTKTINDNGAGSDLLTLLNSFSISDLGNGIEALSLLNQLSISETGIAIEALSILNALSKVDNATATESLNILNSLSISETATGAEILDLLSLIVEILVEENGIGSDEITLIGSALIDIADNATGQDILYILNSISANEIGSGIEDLDILAELNISDSAIGNEFLETLLEKGVFDSASAIDIIAKYLVKIYTKRNNPYGLKVNPYTKKNNPFSIKN